MGFVYRMVSFGLEDFAKRYGALKPSQFVDVVALAGDKSDNIPGYSDILFSSTLWKLLIVVLLYFED